MRRHPQFGIALAALGTLTLTPDALLMRLSGMDGFQMVAWRGLLMGGVLIAAWALISRDRGGDLQQLKSGPGITIMVCQFFNSLLFCLGIAIAPVAVVLFGLAAVPVFAALLSWILIGETVRAATWAAIVMVVLGIGVAVLGGEGEAVTFDMRATLGALLGLGVAVALALNFVVIRSAPRLPIMLAIGCGALVAGGLGLAVTGLEAMTDGRVWAMAATGAIVLPFSFMMLSLASRYTHAANVSLLMLLETVLGPYWVWLGVGEQPSINMLIGGTIVVISLGVYLVVTGRSSQTR